MDFELNVRGGSMPKCPRQVTGLGGNSGSEHLGERPGRRKVHALEATNGTKCLRYNGRGCATGASSSQCSTAPEIEAIYPGHRKPHRQRAGDVARA